MEVENKKLENKKLNTSPQGESFQAISSVLIMGVSTNVSIMYGETGKNVFCFFYKITRRKLKR